MRAKWLVLLLMLTAACATPRSTPQRWSSVEDVCAPVLISLVPGAGVSEYYYISLDGRDPSNSYLTYLIERARSARRSENLKTHSQLEADQSAQPLLRTVIVSCGELQWETADKARVYGIGLLVPRRGEIGGGGTSRVFVLERRNGAWVIVGHEGFGVF